MIKGSGKSKDPTERGHWDPSGSCAVKRIISSVLKFSTKDLVDEKSAIAQISRSIITTFVCRIGAFDNVRAFQRFCMSARDMTARIKKYQTSDSREQSYCKYWLDLLMVKVAGDVEFPVREDWNLDPLFSGWMNWYVKRAIARQDVSMIYSLQKGSKQSWPAMSDEKLAATLQKHKERLGREYKPIPDELFEEIEYWSSKIFSKSSDYSKFVPSPSACLQAPRSKGGASSLFAKFEYPGGSECQRVGKLRAAQHSLHSWRRAEFSRAEEELRKSFQSVQDAMKTLSCEVVAIPEPAKFRVITKGDGYLYTYLQPLQGLMLDQWRKTQFATMKVADLSDAINKIDVNVPFFDNWCSGDYEAATDLLAKDACFAALSPMIKDDRPFAREAMFSMSGAELTYPDGSKIWSGEGQLMGHPLSFPILCVVNLAVYQQSVKDWVRHYTKLVKNESNFQSLRAKIREMGLALRNNVLVNGDDILFKCDKYLFERFRANSSACGLKISQGKNYVSKVLCMINSQLFQRKGDTMKRIGYLNQRFIYGLNIKSQGHFVGSSPTQVHEGLNRMFETANWTTRALPLVMARWGNLFSGRFRPNWFAPLHLGGLGVDKAYAEKFKLTREQRLVAAQFIHDPKLNLVRQGKISPKTAKFIEIPLKETDLIPSMSVKTESESLNTLAAWTGRLNYLDRIAGLNTEPSDEQILFKLGRNWVKPISLEKFEYYAQCEWRSGALPPCPPLSGFPYHHLM